MPKVSIIVPVYNAEKELHRCVDSILAQSFPDFELLLIDDGSTDFSGNIRDTYVIKDSRIRVYHKENGGVSSARNLGLDNAEGEWISFVDSDDYVSEKYLENFILNIFKDVELVISFSVSVFKNKKCTAIYHDGFITSENFDKLFTHYDLSWRTSPWGKLYKKSIIEYNNIKFNEDMPIGEDLVFLYQYISCVDNIFVSSNAYYFYNAENEGSLTKRINSIAIEIICMNNVHMIVDNLILKKNITNKEVIYKTNQLKYTYINRVLNSIYFNRAAFRERIMLLKSINYTSYLLFWEYRKKNIKEYFSYHLIKKRFFCLYDFMRLFNNYIKVLKHV